jgi:hypothetical protein
MLERARRWRMAASSGTDFRGPRDAIWTSALPALHRLIALRMIEHLPNVTPSVDSLALHTGLSRATVIRCIKDLEAWGCVRVARRTGRRSSYELTGSWTQAATKPDRLQSDTGITAQPVSKSTDTGVPQPSPPVAVSNPKQTREADKEAANVGAPPSARSDAGEIGAHEQPASEAVRRIWSHYQARLGHPKAKLDRKRAALIRGRLRDFTADELCRAIDGCAKSDWNMGRDPNSRGNRYDSPELIFRNVGQVERFLGIESREATVPGRAARAHGRTPGNQPPVRPREQSPDEALAGCP